MARETRRDGQGDGEGWGMGRVMREGVWGGVGRDGVGREGWVGMGRDG